MLTLRIKLKFEYFLHLRVLFACFEKQKLKPYNWLEFTLSDGVWGYSVCSCVDIINIVFLRLSKPQLNLLTVQTLFPVTPVRRDWFLS